MKLREAKIIKSKYQMILNELSSNRVKNSSIKIPAGEMVDPLEYITEKPEDITKKMFEIHGELLKLNELFRNACGEERNIIQLNGRYSISVLLDRVKFIRDELYYFKKYASRPQKQYVSSLNSSNLIDVTTYNLQEYKDMAKSLEKEALTISNIIDELDNEVEIDYTIPEGLI